MKSFKHFQGSVTEDTSKKKYSVVRYDAPNSSKVTHSTTVHASNKAELHKHVRNWMGKIGFDPDDEDDYAHVKITVAR